MSLVIRVEDLTGYPVGVEDEIDDIGEDSWAIPPDDFQSIRKNWGQAFLVAIRDRASSLHYHPWRTDGGLAYVVRNVRYPLVPPPAELAAPLLQVAQSFLAPSSTAKPPPPLAPASPPTAVCESVTLEIWEKQFVWDAVFWSTRERSGVEFYRIAPPV